jgi:hypothetical protein
MPSTRLALRVLLLLLILPAGAQASVLVRYTRSGGIAGEMTSLVVKRDRHAARKTRQGDDEFRLSKKRYTALRHALRAAHFAELERSYGPDFVVNDGIDETVTFHGYTVTVSTGGDPPARLEKALDKLRELTQ